MIDHSCEQRRNAAGDVKNLVNFFLKIVTSPLNTLQPRIRTISAEGLTTRNTYPDPYLPYNRATSERAPMWTA